MINFSTKLQFMLYYRLICSKIPETRTLGFQISALKFSRQPNTRTSKNFNALKCVIQEQ